MPFEGPRGERQIDRADGGGDDEQKNRQAHGGGQNRPAQGDDGAANGHHGGGRESQHDGGAEVGADGDHRAQAEQLDGGDVVAPKPGGENRAPSGSGSGRRFRHFAPSVKRIIAARELIKSRDMKNAGRGRSIALRGLALLGAMIAFASVVYADTDTYTYFFGQEKIDMPSASGWVFCALLAVLFAGVKWQHCDSGLVGTPRDGMHFALFGIALAQRYCLSRVLLRCF